MLSTHLRATARLGVLLAGLGSCACSDPFATPDPSFGDGDVRVLFVGNSLTYVNDLPSVVATVAQVAGRSVSTASVVAPGAALEDHWRTGLEARIRELRPDWIIMQQGPSSLLESRRELIAWADTIARVAREVGATPALLMVWPELDRYQVFDAVRDNYKAAADAVGGPFIPAGEAFRTLHDAHPQFEPYGPDDFHPSALGTVVSAFVVVGTLFDVPVTGLPATMASSDPRLPIIRLTAAQAATLQAVADSVVGAWRVSALNTRSAGSVSSAARRPSLPPVHPRP